MTTRHATHDQGNMHSAGTGTLHARPMGESAGSRALAAALTHWTERHIAAECDVLIGRIGQWVRGQCKPNERQRVVLARTYGVPIASWEQP